MPYPPINRYQATYSSTKLSAKFANTPPSQLISTPKPSLPNAFYTTIQWSKGQMDYSYMSKKFLFY
ncbi:hypothetical protein L873DRAFT_1216532 [Choiromyces venosus 120613-1]|uniref:Uncharacterized protein n=1 Tax=Choiromyces venosus 120613-1 TaxID=1336337 RepID=A0A3N4JE38_9PEZI|nr:hypothetical protein L873DRAFT_1216532 [Choiromyces venosus 120613-1]